MTSEDRMIRSIAQLQAMPTCQTALLSGSFNPPHLGHQHIIECALQQSVERVILFPHSHNPRKIAHLLSLDVRIDMLKLLCCESAYSHQIYICDPAIYHGFRENIDPIAEHLGGQDYVQILVGGDHMSVRYVPRLRGYRHLIVQRGEQVEAVCRCVLQTPYHILTHEHPASSTLIRRGSEHDQARFLGRRLYQYMKERHIAF